MNYEEKYKEALEDMRAIYPNLKGDAKLAVEHAFPELNESEDERTREWLLDYFKSVGESWIHRDITPEQIIAYLEKQKEQKPAEWSEEDENMRESAIALIRKWTNYSGENVGDSIKVISWLQWLPLLAHQH